MRIRIKADGPTSAHVVVLDADTGKPLDAVLRGLTFRARTDGEGGATYNTATLEFEGVEIDAEAQSEFERLQRAHVAHTAILKDAGRQREEALGREVEDWKAKCEAAERQSLTAARDLYRVLEREGVLLQRVWDLRQEMLRLGGRA